MKQTTEAKAEATAAELRELVREAHQAIKDMTGLLRAFQKITADGADQARTASQIAANAEIGRFSRHMQAQMNTYAADLNRSVKAAQQHIVRCLTLARLDPDESGGFKFTFKGVPFDADVPLPGQESGE